MSEPLVFLNDKMVPAAEAHLKIYDAGIVLGATVTEMVRTFNKKLYRLEDHLKRLQRALKYVRFDIDMPMEKFATILEELTAHNAGLLHDDDEIGLVIFITAGEFPVYAGSAGATARTQPTICAHTFPMPFELWADKFESGIHLVTPSIRHVPPECYDPNMKYRSRMHYYLADQEAQLVDPAASALLLDLDGNVTETGGSNFLIVENDQIVSPTLRNILPGISRQAISELAHKLGIDFVVRDFQTFNVINAQEAFTCTTPYCMLPVTKINGIELGTGKRGPVFDRLLSAWSELLGVNVEQQFLDGAKRRKESM